MKHMILELRQSRSFLTIFYSKLYLIQTVFLNPIPYGSMSEKRNDFQKKREGERVKNENFRN